MITFKDILTTYWAQTILILAALGYFIKRILDLRAKKIAEKQRLFQQERQLAIVKFMKIYIDLQKLFRKLIPARTNITTILNTDFVEDISNGLEELYAAYFLFKLYLDPLEASRYTDLMIAMQKLSNKIIEYHTLFSIAKTHISETELKTNIAETLAKNNDNIKVIGEIFRKNASKHYAIEF